jgi:hypothetical protein
LNTPHKLNFFASHKCRWNTKDPLVKIFRIN